MKVTADEYELPIFVTDTAIAHRNHDGKKSSYVRVDFEEDD